MGVQKKDVLVVAHDAGAAEIIAAYVKKKSATMHFHCYIAGPAKAIFKRNKCG